MIAMYVAQAIQNRTVLLLTGRGQRMIEQSCALARALQPSIVILEDDDLVAEERTRPGAACAGPLLFELPSNDHQQEYSSEANPEAPI